MTKITLEELGSHMDSLIEKIHNPYKTPIILILVEDVQQYIKLKRLVMSNGGDLIGNYCYVKNYLLINYFNEIFTPIGNMKLALYEKNRWKGNTDSEFTIQLKFGQ